MARECTSLKSGSNQVTVWTSGEAGIYTVINCLSLPDNEEDKVTEVSFLDTHFQPSWMEEQIRHSERYHSIPQTAIPEWFNYRLDSCIPIPLPPDLSKNSKWRGIVLYTTFEVDVSPGQDSNNFHELVWHLNMDGGLADCTINFNAPKDQCDAGSFGLCLYISRARFKDHLDGRNCISPSITTSSSIVRIQTCGGRILYEQDMVEFVQIVTQKNFGYSHLIMIAQGGGTILPVDVTDSLDFHPSNSYNYCFPPGKIEEWFSHHSCGNSAAINLPPNLYHDDSWMGIAVCTSFSIHGDPKTILNNLVPEISQVLFGQFRTNLGFFRHKCRQEIMWLMNLGKFIWISYIPGELIMRMINQRDTHIAASLEENRNDTELDDEVAIGGTVHSNKELEVEMIVNLFVIKRIITEPTVNVPHGYIEASIATDCTGLTAQTCGFRLLFENDEVEFDEAECHYSAADGKHELAEFMNSCAGPVQVVAAAARMRQHPVTLRTVVARVGQISSHPESR
ncbi:hypothetical protein CJ030_MR3G006309 [Morella rubra]|uniref:C-JID domain-containing protein n=1 Tax=Morella rubra TaxID=262757 RepID=A0A6A1WB23_9ROSI|nr:hypothetical protein CJ030_MR3G006309 [Morella rubra]